MNLQFRTDNNIAGSAALEEKLRQRITHDLSRYDQQITTVEVHLGDENSHKEGARDKRCMIEVRLEGLQPIAATAHEDTIEQAVKAALTKVKSAIDSARGRLNK